MMADRHERSPWWGRLPLISLAVVLGIAAIIGVILLRPPIVGLADNGSYQWVMGPLGVRHVTQDPGEAYFDYLVTEYAVEDHPTAGTDSGVRSSESLVARVALFLDGTFTDPAWFDLRAMGATHMAVWVLGIAIGVVGLRRVRGVLRAISVVFLAVIAIDVGYVAYFNSFYTQAAALVFGMMVLGAALLAAALERPAPAIILVGVVGPLFVTANGDVAVLALPVALLALLVGYLGPSGSARIASALAAVAILFAGVWSYVSVPSELQDVNHYNVVFTDLLTHSSEPESILEQLGLEPSLAEYAGTNYHEPDAPIDDAAFRKRFFAKMSDLSLVRFYLTSPGETLAQLSRNASQAFELRPEFLANVPEASAGEPKQQYRGFSVWTGLHTLVFPGQLWFVLVVPLTAIAIGLFDLRRRRDQVRSISYGVPGVLAVLGLATLVAYAWTVLLTGEVDLVLRLAVFNLLFDLSILGLFATAIGRVARQATAVVEERDAQTDGQGREQRAKHRPRVR